MPIVSVPATGLRIFCLLAALMSGLFVLTPKDASAAVEARKFGMWTLRCAETPDRSKGQADPCELVLSVRNNGQDLAELAIGFPKKGDKKKGDELVVAGRTPLGVLLSEPMRLGAKLAEQPIQLSFFTCLADGCLARALVTSEALRSATNSDVVHLSFRERTGRALTIVVPTNGLDDALSHMASQLGGE